MIGEGNHTKGSVGTEAQAAVQVKLASNESARAAGATATTKSKPTTQNVFRNPLSPHGEQVACRLTQLPSF